MGCPTCGVESPPGAKFCAECGARLATTCPTCGHEVGLTAKFCQECGGSLAGTQAAGSPRPSGVAVAPASASPKSYTPRHLAEKILASRDALEGERKQVTVLFADVVGSTELIQGRDAEDAQALLDGVVQVMMDAVHKYEGTVSRLMGDGLMALFGAPLAHEDHAVRACYAALAMQESMRRHADEVRREQGAVIAIRVGLSAGEVVVRTIRDDLHMDFTAMGQTVHLAARMEQLAKPDTTTLTPDALALVEGYVQVRSLGPVPVKGLPEPIEVFELLGAGAPRTRLQAAATRGLTRFVGRDAEMTALYAALARAGSGQGQVAALVGEPGVGKSRLAWELTHSHRTEGWLVLESGSVSYGKATSYLPVIDLLKAYCRVETRDDERAIREKVTGKLLTLDRALESILSPLLALLDVPVEDAGWERLDPAQRRRQTLDAVKRLLLRESQEQPLLLVFEDLHWIDAETQALLDGLIESLPTARLLLVVNYRPEYSHAWGSKTYYTQLRIDPLGHESADDLLAGLLGDDSAVAGLKTALIERTEGNPFFLEEGVRSLIESGQLIGERGDYRLAGPLASIRVPATVQAVLAARIDRLPPDDKRLLQTASVVGKDLPYAVLAAIAGLPDEQLQAGLGRLQAAEFLYQTSLFPDLEYTFKHALTHEVTYGSLLQERRRALHGRVLPAIERLYPDRLEEHVERLAQHAMRGEDWIRAVPYARSAAEKAITRSAFREAQIWFEEALSAVRQLPRHRDTIEQEIDLRLDLCRVLVPLGELHLVPGHLREAEALAESLSDRRRLATVGVNVAKHHQQVGDSQRAVEYGERVLALGNAIGDSSIRFEANSCLGVTYHTRGEFRRAVRCYRWVVEHLEGNPLRERSGDQQLSAVMAHAGLGYSLAALGDFDEAACQGAEAIRIAELADHPLSRTGAYFHLGLVYLEKGDLALACSLLEAGLDLARTTDLPFHVRLISMALGHLYAQTGRLTEGITLLERSIQQFAAMGHLAYQSLRAGWLSAAYLLAGRREDARRLGEHAVELGVEHGESGHQSRALQLLAKIAACGDPPDVEEAETRYREALALAEESEMRPLQARCHLGLGKLYRQVGRSDEARAELSTAVGMLHEMGMLHWLPEAEAELAQATAATSEGRPR